MTPPPAPTEGTPARGRLGTVALALATAALVALAVSLPDGTFEDPSRLRATVARAGPLGPALGAALAAAQVVAAPIPGQLVGAVNGFLFGPTVGLAATMAGLVIGSAVAIGLARRLGRPFAERFVEPTRLAALDAAVDRYGDALVLAVFLLPFLPDDALCFALGVTRMPVRRAVVFAAIGRLPGTAVACVLGAGTVRLAPLEWAGLAALVLGVSVPLSAAVRRALARGARPSS